MKAVGAVNHRSARTTNRLTTPCAATLPLRLAKKRKKAEPRPVPTMSTLETMCSHLSSR